MRYFVLILTICFSGQLSSQKFTATTNARELVNGSTFSVSFELENARPTNFNAPDFSPFRVITGPSQSQSTSIINGRRSSSFKFSYSLVATKVGTFTIPPATAQVNGRTLTSNPMKVKVVERGETPEGGRDLFVRIELDTDSLYIGQQVVMSLKLYSKKAVERFDILYMPEFEDIYVKDIPIYNRRARLEVVDGEQYQTQVLSRRALYPQKSGVYNFDGLVVRLGIPTNRRRRSSFFFSNQITTRDVTTDDFGFLVMPLPEPQPENFSGGVGSYAVRASVDRTSLTTDDALSLTMSVQGDGDQRLLIPPELDLGEAFETYDANLVNTDERPGEDRNRFVKIFEYLVIPRKAGQLEIAPEFVYYSVDSQDYITVVPDTFFLSVEQGTSESRALDRFKASQDIEIQPIVHEWRPAQDTSVLILQPWYWSIFGVTGLAFIGLLWFRNNQIREAQTDPRLLKFKRANKVARKRLKIAESLMHDGQTNAFFEEVALSTKQYLGDKLQVDPARFSRKTISEELESLDVADDLKADVIKLLNDCDLAIFASTYSPDMKEVYERALRTVTELEEYFGR
ncbi:MAG: BatD family protein [Saprospiraceae bacterium]|nr:BatD family protein [Saprospiraceae bacterium]